MRIIMLDLDTLRPGHMGCYGYERNTTPYLDRISSEGCRFDNYYCSDAPCLPSRAALITGKFGIHNGVVGHGGTAADLCLEGRDRSFRNQLLEEGFFNIFRKAGYYTASFSSFAERHSAFWFNAGLNETHNCGMGGGESAEEVMPKVLDWVNANADKDQWFLHVNLWDAHTPYKAPAEFGNPFENVPMPAWITEEVFEEHKRHVGPHSINELNMFDGNADPQYPRQPGCVSEYKDLKAVFDGYDCGIRYMDSQIGQLMSLLEEKGIYEDTAFIITADHGEDMGELGVYCEHGVADEAVSKIPMIIKLPGIKKKVDKDLHYNIDLLPTLADYFSLPYGQGWDGSSFYPAMLEENYKKRDYLVLSQCAHVCQRSVRFGKYLYMRTYHAGLHLFPKEMLFDVESDPHEQYDLAEKRPDLCGEACRILSDWHDEMMMSSDTNIDPLWTVLKEGGPFHCRGCKEIYAEQLRRTGRSEGAQQILDKYKMFD